MLIKNECQLNIPRGFVTLEPDSKIVYNYSDYYAPETEGVLQWNDPDIGIKKSLKGNPTVSERDIQAPLIKGFESPIIFGENA